MNSKQKDYFIDLLKEVDKIDIIVNREKILYEFADFYGSIHKGDMNAIKKHGQKLNAMIMTFIVKQC